MYKEKVPDGFVVIVHNSLNKPNMVFGVPTDAFMLNALLFGYVGFIGEGYPIIAVNIIIHFIFMFAAKQDPIFMLS